jgi:hypothetical protein
MHGFGDLWGNWGGCQGVGQIIDVKLSLKGEKIPWHSRLLLAGVAGEYFVAAELTRRGYIASISLRNTRGIDILATNQAATKSFTIQCKTNQLTKSEWLLNEKSEAFVAKNHFYVFVALGDVNERPSYHIVPSAIVSESIHAFHTSWLNTPGKQGQKHVDNSMRKFIDPNNIYREQWDLLGL